MGPECYPIEPLIIELVILCGFIKRIKKDIQYLLLLDKTDSFNYYVYINVFK